MEVRWTDPEGGEPLEGYIDRDALRSVIDYRLPRLEPQRPLADHHPDRGGLGSILPGNGEDWFSLNAGSHCTHFSLSYIPFLFHKGRSLFDIVSPLPPRRSRPTPSLPSGSE